MTVRLYKVSSGQANVSSTLWNATNSLLASNIILLGIDQSATYTNLQNVWFESLSGDTNLDSKTGAMIDNNRAWFFKNIDDFEDASIAATLWTAGGSTAESGGAIGYATTAQSATATLIGNGASAIDFKALTGDSEIYLKVLLQAEANNSGANEWGGAMVQISNGATHVNIYGQQYSSGQSGTFDTGIVNLILYVDKANEDVYYSADEGATWSGAVDISTATTNWYIRLYMNITNGGAPNNSVTAGFTLYDIGYINASATGGQTVNLIMDAFTAESSSDTIVCASQGTQGTIQPAFSFDAGGSYENFTLRSITKNSVSGSTCKIKFTATLPSGAMTVGTKPHAPYLKQYGVIYG
jgi:hypothetical protein